LNQYITTEKDGNLSLKIRWASTGGKAEGMVSKWDLCWGRNFGRLYSADISGCDWTGSGSPAKGFTEKGGG
jgi:hypothetical protein